MELTEVLRCVERLISSSQASGSLLGSLAGNIDTYRTFLQDLGREALRERVENALVALDIPSCTHTLGSKGEEAEAVEVYRKFTAHALSLLCVLDDTFKEAAAEDKNTAKAALTTPASKPAPPPKALLSSSQEKSIATLLQFIVSLGLFPYLLPGVDHLLCLKLTHIPLLHKAHCPLETKNVYLHLCCSALVRMTTTPVLGPFVLRTHFSNILSGLIQVCYAPKDSNLHKEEEGSDKNVLTHDFAQLRAEQREWCEREIRNLLSKTHQPLVVRELLALQGMSSKKQGSGEDRHERGNGQRVDEGGREGRREGGSGRQTLRHPILATPRWMQRVCGRLLSERLMQERGVLSVVKGIFEAMGDNDAVGDWKKAQAVATIIASCPSQAGSVEEYYASICPQILELTCSPAGGGILRVAAATMSTMLKRQPSLARTYLLNPILKPLKQLSTDSTVQSLKNQSFSKDLEACTVTLSSLCTTVEPSSPLRTSLLSFLPIIFDLWRACCSSGGGRNSSLRSVEQVCRACKNSNVKHTREVLVSVLSPLSLSTVISFLRYLAGFSRGEERGGEKEGGEEEWVSLQPGLAVVWEEDMGEGVGGLKVRIEEEEEDEGKVCVTVFGKWSVEKMENIGNAILKLLQEDLKSSALVGPFFIHCMSHIAAVLCQSIGYQPNSSLVKREVDMSLPCRRRKDERFSGSSAALLEVEQNITTPTQREAFYQSLVLYLTAALSEVSSDAVLQQAPPTQLLEVLTCIVQCHAHLTTMSPTPSFSLLVVQSDLSNLLGGTVTLSIAVGYLSALLTDLKKVSRDLRPQLTALLTPLEDISSSYPDPDLQGLAKDLRVCIATLGAVWSTELKVSTTSTAASSNATATDGSKRKQSSGTAQLKQVTPTYQTTMLKETASLHQPTAQKTSPFYLALSELQDPLIPVQGHALASLAKLIRSADRETLTNSEHLLQVFKENLHHSDSYIYLAAISGLVALASLQRKQVLEVLCVEFATPCDASSSSGRKRRYEADRTTGVLKVASIGKASVEERAEGRKIDREKSGKELLDLRLKLGEALARVVKECGETLPVYLDQLLGALLPTVHDPESLVRASALSALAEVCRLLGHSVGSVLHEILSCVSGVLLTDSTPPVRQAALLTLLLLLQGQGAAVVQSLDGSLKDIYHLLQQVERDEEDTVTRVHAQAALGELDRLMRDWAFPQQKLEKKISFL